MQRDIMFKSPRGSRVISISSIRLDTNKILRIVSYYMKPKRCRVMQPSQTAAVKHLPNNLYRYCSSSPGSPISRAYIRIYLYRDIHIIPICPVRIKIIWYR